MPPNIELLQQKQNLNIYHAPTGLIDSKDLGTPDAHVSRDSNITRLTGKHPLNAGMFYSAIKLQPMAYITLNRNTYSIAYGSWIYYTQQPSYCTKSWTCSSKSMGFP